MSALDLSLGCIYIGVMLNVWLYGFSCVQAYIYFTRFKADRRAMRTFVLFLFCADTVNTVLDVTFLYKYLVTNYGQLTYASRSNNEFATDPLCVSTIGFATQLFFAWRIWCLLPGRFSWAPPLIIGLLGLLSFLGALGTTIGVVIVREFASFQKFEVTVIVWLACTAAADVVITLSLITTLHRARTGFTHTDDVITKLIRATLQTGLLTTSFAVIDLILFVTSTTTLHLAFNLPLSKLYVNSLLSTLNARASAQNRRSTLHNTGLHGVSSSRLKIAEAGLTSTLSAYSPTTSHDAVAKDFAPTPAQGYRHHAASAEPYGHESRSTNKTNARQSLDSKRLPGSRGLLNPWKRSHPAEAIGNTASTVAQQAENDGVQIVTVEERFESGTLPSCGTLPPAISLKLLNKSTSFTTESQYSGKGGDPMDAGDIGNAMPLQRIRTTVQDGDKSLSDSAIRHPYNQC